ncbi:sugar phosphate isomerase/epimerase [Bradyrhizobium sp. U87765 SZCCT0131]|uniref:sugar phosphate isomerase/epimerase family protein n=1 Tax=unclassified Bradyrhizobium TaxID=2631580 RepID=UPI001BAAB85E|nr:MULTISPECIES: sugar phosphate isomerase/epimerase [unclassified Bradyrhizobium]MBR1219022.1 sugar phosphate isomerase/epimerase [Bradyrhizobium sp. U87765 SZCCT0131]MBR1261673.1 sugar phosphate isomerase/epimerase [Bradyrhizobium sp. U87765 SZCCT0134]MBR1306474.1 sugar phosphate isomerase/epimerase [Bradyrhizobium sp. U87765 SZCCT0110]MBR1317455.1 sugar phosphate isomerase/epimerase [Bradyrhizobium sp. U87765 SZCCT0109]MBR1351157.1 sugar phosphate isomerase/epimerase [Bradyrhizobium sp. U87
MRILSLAHLTLISADALALIDAAAAARFSHVGLRIVPPTPDAPMRPVIGDKPYQRDILARLAETGLNVLDIEAFWLTPDTDIAAIAPAFAFGAELGATYVVVVGNDPERTRLVERFAALSELAQRHGLKTSLEFIPYSTVASLDDAASVVRAAAQPNAGLLVDALHLSRSGGTPAQLAALPQGLVHYLHLCDAPAVPPPDVAGMKREARGERCYPGEGGLPLAAFLGAVAADVPVGIEAPDGRRAALSFAEQARQARAAALALAPLGALASPGDPQ